MADTFPVREKSLIILKLFRKRSAAAIVIFIIFSSLLGWLSLAYDKNMQRWWPEMHTLASVYNRKRSGTSGLAEIAVKAGLKSEAWLLPYRQLSDTKGTLFIFEPSTSLQEFEIDQLLRWVAKGNRLIYFDQFGYEASRLILQKEGIAIADGLKLVDCSIEPDPANSLCQHVKTLFVSAETRLSGGETILSDQSGNLIVKKKHGNGEVFLGCCPSIGSNGRLADKRQWGNFQFLINLARQDRGKILFDERCHGYTKSQNVFVFLAQKASGLVFAQLGLILLLAIFGASNKFGPEIVLKSERNLSALDFITGLSNLYRRAKANLLVIEILSRSYRKHWCKATGTSASERAEELESKWLLSFSDNQTMKQWSKESAELLNRIEKLGSEDKLSDEEMLSFSAALEAANDRCDSWQKAKENC
jgi:hypothetical protein